jgi:hypothetical protein
MIIMVHKLEQDDSGKTYKIMRFYEDGRPARVIMSGLSLEQAQAHCSDPKTHKVHKDGSVEWFDGYTAEE